MLPPVFSRLRIVVVAAVCAGLPQYLQAQFSTPGSTLSQPLTDNPGSAPVTTLDTELLTPLRPFSYDPTGASILSTALSPLVDTTNASAVRVETDTAIRDSTQTGQSSPYAASASRLGLSLSGKNASLGGEQYEGAGGGAAGGDAHFGLSSGEEDGNSEQSSWGTSSSFGSPSTGSRFRTRAGSNTRLSLNQSASSDSDLPSTLSVAVSGDERLSSSSGRGIGVSSASRRTKPGTALGGGASRRTGGMDGSVGMASSGVASGPSDNTPTSGEAALAFAPQSYRGYSFGESPFSSPAGNGELTFLNPNIFAVSPPRLGSSGGPSAQRRGTLREQLEQEEGLATSSTGYGLSSRHRGMESERLSSTKKKSARNPYVSGDNPHSQ